MTRVACPKTREGSRRAISKGLILDPETESSPVSLCNQTQGVEIDFLWAGDFAPLFMPNASLIMCGGTFCDDELNSISTAPP